MKVDLCSQSAQFKHDALESVKILVLKEFMIRDVAILSLIGIERIVQVENLSQHF